MDELILIEKNLFGDNPDFDNLVTDNYDFLVNRLLRLPKYRPFLIEKVVSYCSRMLHIDSFKALLINESVFAMPIIIRRLYEMNMIDFSLINGIINGKGSFEFCFYFINEIQGFRDLMNNHFPNRKFDQLHYLSIKDIELMIKYGFTPSSIEYSLKYDDITSLQEKMINPNGFENYFIKHTSFEWSKCQSCKDALSFAGFFGSIHCFKYLILNGFTIKESVAVNAVCSGSHEIFHLCLPYLPKLSILLNKASEFGYLPIIEYLVEQKVEINRNNKDYLTILIIKPQLLLHLNKDTFLYLIFS